jgi:AcrR family transcriptional regulator
VPRVKQRTEALHERGLAGALTVLEEDGVAGLTTRAVARRAGASVPAIYEVFGDKAGIVREIFFEGFRLLADELSDGLSDDLSDDLSTARAGDLEATPAKSAVRDDPVDALRGLAERFRRFVVGRPVLAQVMFSRPFADFDPGQDEVRAGAKVRKLFVQHVRNAVDAGALSGDPTDLALVFFTLIEGLAAAENARRLGSSQQSTDRRWDLAVNALLAGMR